MAITTAAQIETEVAAHFPSEDTSTIQSYVAIAIDRLCFTLPIIKATYSLKLTADTQEYAFGAGSPWYGRGLTTTATTASVIRIESATYVPESGGHKTLVATVPQYLDQTQDGWRYTDSGTPTAIYTQTGTAGAMSVGFWPMPDTTSSPATGAGYPRVDFATWNTFSSGFTGTVTVPSCIRNPLIIVYGALYAIYGRENEGDGQQWFNLYNRELGILTNQLATMHRDYKPNISNRPRFRRQT